MQVVAGDAVLDLQTKHFTLNCGEMRSHINKALFLCLSEELLDEVDVDIKLDFAGSDLVEGGQLCDMLEYLTEELFAEGCSFVGD